LCLKLLNVNIWYDLIANAAWFKMFIY